MEVDKMILNQFINRGSDEDTINYLQKSFTSEDNLQKAMNRARLVQKEVQVRGKNGQVYTRKQWVKASEDSSKNSSGKSTKSKNEDKNTKSKSDFDFSSIKEDEYEEVVIEDMKDVLEEEKGFEDSCKAAGVTDNSKIITVDSMDTDKFESLVQNAKTLSKHGDFSVKELNGQKFVYTSTGGQPAIYIGSKH